MAMDTPPARLHPPPRTVLFIRAVPLTQALPALRWLRAQMPQAAIVALTSSGAAPAIEGSDTVDGVRIHDRARFGAGPAALRHLAPLWRLAPDLVVVPCVGNRRAFRNVARFALAIRAGSTVWLDCARLASGDPQERVLEAIARAEVRDAAPGAPQLRRALLGLLRWPLLIGAWAIALLLLTVAIAVLRPLVWLAPDREEPA